MRFLPMIALPFLLASCAAEAPRSLEPTVKNSAQATKDSDYADRLETAVSLMELKLLSRLATEHYRNQIVSGTQVSDKEVRAYYKKRKNDYLIEPFFTAHQVLVYVKGNPAFPDRGRTDVEARRVATEALAALRAGQTWKTVVQSWSDEGGHNGGEGLILEGRFGYFAPEVEHAVRTQPIGQPGKVFRSAFGYHVVQVDKRVIEKEPQAFSAIEPFLRDRLNNERSAASGQAFMEPLRRKFGLEITDAGRHDWPLLDESALARDEVLARLGGKAVIEADFRSFVNDALIPSQRMSAYSRPGARQSMLRSYLDMLVLAAEARKEGLHTTTAYLQVRAELERQLHSEFKDCQAGTGPLVGQVQ